MGNAPDIPPEELNLTHMRTITALVGSMQRVQRSNGDRVGYDRLVLATGGTARCCSLPGSDKSNVYCPRSLADAERLQRALDGFGNLVIVGGVNIGLEIAAVARTLGMATTVVEEAPRILARTAHPKSKPSLRKNTVCAVSISAPTSRCEPCSVTTWWTRSNSLTVSDCPVTP